MATIGRRIETGASQTPDFVSDNQAISLLNNVYTAGPNEQVFEFGFAAGASFDSDASVSIALYNVTDAISLTNPNNASLVAQVAWLPSEITAGAINTKSITPVLLVEGQEYAVDFKVDASPSGAAYWMRQLLGSGPTTYRATQTGSDAFPSSFSWNNTTIGLWEYVVFAETESAASEPSITNINGDNTLNNNQTGNTIEYADFTDQSGLFTLDLRNTADSTALSQCTSLSLASGTGTFNAPNIRSIGETPTKGSPLTTTNNSVEALLTETDTEETALIGVTLSAESGYSVVEVLGAVKSVGSIFENVAGSIVDESIIYQPTANSTTVSQTGIVTTDQTTGSINFWLWKKDEGEWERIIFELGDGGGGLNLSASNVVESVVQSVIKEI